MRVYGPFPRNVAKRQNRPLVPWQPMLRTLVLLPKGMRAEQLSINLPIGKTHNAIYSQVHKYWDIDTILTFLALYTTTMDFK